MLHNGRLLHVLVRNTFFNYFYLKTENINSFSRPLFLLLTTSSTPLSLPVFLTQPSLCPSLPPSPTVASSFFPSFSLPLSHCLPSFVHPLPFSSLPFFRLPRRNISLCHPFSIPLSISSFPFPLLFSLNPSLIYFFTPSILPSIHAPLSPAPFSFSHPPSFLFLSHFPLFVSICRYK